MHYVLLHVWMVRVVYNKARRYVVVGARTQQNIRHVECHFVRQV